MRCIIKSKVLHEIFLTCVSCLSYSAGDKDVNLRTEPPLEEGVGVVRVNVICNM